MSPLIEYVPRTFAPASEALIDQANVIITQYQAQGFSLTLRQLYYQFVARGWIANRMTEYKRLGSIINDARLAGLIDWEAIEDRTRWLRSTDMDHGDPDTWLGQVYQGFKKARWDDQPVAVEVWVEKDALVGVIEAACDPLYVPYFACRGYASQSELWAAGRRLAGHDADGKQVVIIHLGDHDPSGIDMTRDIEDRLNLFMQYEGAQPPEIRRIALNYSQVQQYSPPPNPAKLTDSRAESYIGRFGGDSWELDALDPAVLVALITSEIEPLIDRKLWRAVEARERDGQSRLKLVADRWEEAVEYLEST